MDVELHLSHALCAQSRVLLVDLGRRLAEAAAGKRYASAGHLDMLVRHVKGVNVTYPRRSVTTPTSGAARPVRLHTDRRLVRHLVLEPRVTSLVKSFPPGFVARRSLSSLVVDDGGHRRLRWITTGVAHVGVD